MQLYYGSEYFLGNVKTMKEDIINYVSKVMIDKGYKIMNNNTLIERTNKDTNKKIPKFEQELYKIQITSIPPANNNDNIQITSISPKNNYDKIISIPPIINKGITNKFGCKCGHIVKTKNQLEKHQNKCSVYLTNPEDCIIQFTCCYCQKVLTTKFNCERHMISCKKNIKTENDVLLTINDDFFKYVNKELLSMTSFINNYKNHNDETRTLLQETEIYKSCLKFYNWYKLFE